jgi:hypothetical protein
MFKNRNLTIAAITMAALLGTGIFSTTSVYAGDDENKYNSDGGDRSETNTEQKLKQSNEGDGTNTNCGQNLIDSSGIVCFDPTDGTGDGNGGDGVATCEECIDEFLDSVPATSLALVEAALGTCLDLTTEAEITAVIDALGLIVGVDAEALAILEACLLAAIAV